MKLPKLTFLSLVVCTSVLLGACERDAEMKKTTDFEKKGIILSGSQETPATTSAALGKMDVFYSKGTRTLTFSVDWSGLTGSVTAMHIHGLAPVGYSTGIVQTLSTSAIVRCPTSSTTACGRYAGTMQVDGFVVKEEDLINGMYYVNLHTAAFPGGEIRGQIRFQ